jgi:hypothetical protein
MQCGDPRWVSVITDAACTFEIYMNRPISTNSCCKCEQHGSDNKEDNSAVMPTSLEANSRQVTALWRWNRCAGQAICLTNGVTALYSSYALDIDSYINLTLQHVQHK